MHWHAATPIFKQRLPPRRATPLYNEHILREPADLAHSHIWREPAALVHSLDVLQLRQRLLRLIGCVYSWRGAVEGVIIAALLDVFRARLVRAAWCGVDVDAWPVQLGLGQKCFIIWSNLFILKFIIIIISGTIECRLTPLP